MLRQPALFVTELFGDVPLKARCTACDDVKFDISMRVGKQEDHERRLNAMFAQHLEQFHGPAAAARSEELDSFESIKARLPGLLDEQAAVLNSGRLSDLSADVLNAFQDRAAKIVQLQTWLGELVRNARKRPQ